MLVHGVSAEFDAANVPVLGVTPGASVHPPIIDGRAIETASEVVLGTETILTLGKRVGDTVRIRDDSGRDRRLRIVGTATNKASLVSFVVAGVHPHDLGTILDEDGIAIRTGHHCAMPVMEFFKVPATARASFAFYNTFDEIDRLAAGIERARKLFA